MTRAESFAMQYGYYDKEKKRACCVGYNAGYKQAGQDLTLTAEDVGCIIHLADQFGKDYQRIADVFNKDRKEENETQYKV